MLCGSESAYTPSSVRRALRLVDRVWPVVRFAWFGCKNWPPMIAIATRGLIWYTTEQNYRVLALKFSVTVLCCPSKFAVVIVTRCTRTHTNDERTVNLPCNNMLMSAKHEPSDLSGAHRVFQWRGMRGCYFIFKFIRDGPWSLKYFNLVCLYLW